MMDEQAPEEAHNAPENESHENRGPGKLQRRIAEAAVLALYFVFEFPSAYEESHERAFLQLFVGVCSVLLIELRLKICAITSAIVLALLAAGYWYLGPTPPPPPSPPKIGWLQPADRPMPESSCKLEAADPNSVIVVAGSSSYIVPKLNHTLGAIALGWCHSLTVHSTENGISIDADLYGEDGKKLGAILNNGYKISGDITVEKSGDLSTIVVHDQKGNEFIYASYVNKRAFVIRGKFFCSAPRRVAAIITDRSATLYPGRKLLTGGCIIGGKYGLVLR